MLQLFIKTFYSDTPIGTHNTQELIILLAIDGL